MVSMVGALRSALLFAKLYHSASASSEDADPSQLAVYNSWPTFFAVIRAPSSSARWMSWLYVTSAVTAVVKMAMNVS